jgi:excisionase family DNA binding protein
MSSNLRIKKVCQHCKEIFTAKQHNTKFCSDNCAKRNYKLREHKAKLEAIHAENESILLQKRKPSQATNVSDESIELIDVTTLAVVTSLSESTIYRLIRSPEFPKIKIGRNLRFHKETVIEFIKEKYTVYARTSEKKGTKGR